MGQKTRLSPTDRSEDGVVRRSVIKRVPRHDRMGCVVCYAATAAATNGVDAAHQADRERATASLPTDH